MNLIMKTTAFILLSTAALVSAYDWSDSESFIQVDSERNRKEKPQRD